jgi:4-oxalomesaconate tautomerase
MTNAGVRCMLMRGGTSKGAYFVKSDLPADARSRDELLMAVMGTPDPRQIDGIGGAHPLTSKVAVVSASTDKSERDGADVDYLFLQVGVERAFVTDQQNCGNLLAGVGPFAVERGLVRVTGERAEVRIRMLNTGGVATARFPLVDGRPDYSGSTSIAGVPGTSAAVELEFSGTAGSTCGALFPSGNSLDLVQGVRVTCIDNGMPVVVLRAADVGVRGDETCDQLEANKPLRSAVERIRLEGGRLMGLGDVRTATVPKMTLVSPPTQGGTLCTRTFIPHRCHDAIGVLGAVSVATAALVPGTPAAEVSSQLDDPGRVTVEHPTGTLDATVEVRIDANGAVSVARSGILRTARMLMDGTVYPRT